ncbi:MAG: hypothetical protein EPO07_10075 [Verrucomicrobia bacterium]|nr:MAG: hypothetical protein EPO07_10075 [Verrucomicrobiota bacterium]
MSTVAIQTLELLSFAAASIIVAFAGSKPAWRIRAIVYGWGLFTLWALCWGIIMPMCFNNVLDAKALSAAFPEGTIVPGFLFCGWLCSGLIVELVILRQRAKRRKDSNRQS